jgi:hypothetical protein
MAAATQHVPKSRFYAGLCRRTKSLTRFWSWTGDEQHKKQTNPSTSEMDRPWTGLADWLPEAHSLLDDKTAE